MNLRQWENEQNTHTHASRDMTLVDDDAVQIIDVTRHNYDAQVYSRDSGNKIFIFVDITPHTSSRPVTAPKKYICFGLEIDFA